MTDQQLERLTDAIDRVADSITYLANSIIGDAPPLSEAIERLPLGKIAEVIDEMNYN